MWVVTVHALHQTFVHPVVKRFGKISLGGSVAAIAQLRLTLDQQVLLLFGMVRRVAVETTDIAAGVGGLGKTRLFVSFAMAAETAGAAFLPRLSFEHKYLRFVAAAGHVLGAGTMTTLATLL
jgi:hypothetical protein